jgi:hypothetical protein
LCGARRRHTYPQDAKLEDLMFSDYDPGSLIQAGIPTFIDEQLREHLPGWRCACGDHFATIFVRERPLAPQHKSD